MYRRDVLAAAAASVSLSSGCGGLPTSGQERDWPVIVLQMTPYAEADPLEALMPLAERRGVEEFVGTQNTTARAHEPPIRQGRHVVYDGSVYNLSYTTESTSSGMSYAVEINPVTPFPEGPGTIPFGDLPEVDRQKLAGYESATSSELGVGFSLVYTDEERPESVLVPEPEFRYLILESGTAAEWRVRSSMPLVVHTYEYSSEVVASTAEFRRRLRRRFAFELDDLTESQRAIVQTAISEGYYRVDRDGTISRADREIVERFQAATEAHPPDEQPGLVPGYYVVRVDDEVYWADLTVDRSVLEEISTTR